MVNKGIVYIGDVSGNLGTINSSGQIRVEAAVSIPPVSANVSGNSVYLPNDGVNNVVSISGQTVVASVNVAANVSGNTVYLVDDGVNNKVKVSGQTIIAQISGQTVTISNAVSTGVSGQTVYLVNDSVNNVTKVSGQLVAVSGIVNIGNASIAVTLPANAISGNAERVSGQTIYLVDDSVNNKVKVSGQTVSVSGIVAVNSLPVISVSGNVIQISGQTVTVANAVSTGVSGQTIYLVDNGVNNVVKISGQTVVASVVTNISGQVVATSGATVYLVADSVNNKVRVSGEAVRISGQLVNVAAVGGSVFEVTWDNDGANNVVKISGETVIAQVSLGTTPTSGDASRISGQTIYIIDDSVNNKVKVSGQTVSVSGIVAVNSLPVISISGNMVSISGQPVTANVTTNISGQTVYLATDNINNSVFVNDGSIAVYSLPVISVSGNTVRTSGQTTYLINDSINNVVKVSGQYVTVSGSVEITNPGDIICSISGNTVYLISGFNPVQVSGQSVRLPNDGVNNVVSISGQTVVASVSMGPTPTSGDTSRISGQTIYIIDDSVNNRVKVSGQTVSVSGSININNASLAVTLPAVPTSGDASRISGQTIYIIDDSVNNKVKVSGQTVSVSGIVTVNSLPVISVSGNTIAVSGSIAVNSLPVISISGNAVRTSGQVTYLVNDGVNNIVSISGQTVVASVSMGPTPTSGDAARVSGQTIYLVNDSVNNKVRVSGETVSVSGSISVNNSITVGTLPVISISGNMVSISGQPVTANVTTNISGQVVAVSGSTVYFVNNGVNNVVQISGQTVVASVTTNISGQHVSVSGVVQAIIRDSVGTIPVVQAATGDDALQDLDNALTVAGLGYGYDEANGQWARLRVGQTPFKLFVTASGDAMRVSGQVMRLPNDGVNNVVQISGQTVVASVTTNISGQHVSVSGIVQPRVPTAIRTRAELACTALSGGTQLLSGDVRKATVLNAGSAGTVMYIGSTTDPPFSGFGFRLVAGNGWTVETSNFNNIRAFGATSGIMISYIGEQF